MCCNLPYTHVGKLFLQAAQSLLHAVSFYVAGSCSATQCCVGISDNTQTDFDFFYFHSKAVTLDKEITVYFSMVGVMTSIEKVR